MNQHLTRRRTLQLAGGLAAGLVVAPAIITHPARAAATYKLIDIGMSQPDPNHPELFLGVGRLNNQGDCVGNIWISDEKVSPYTYFNGKLSRIKTGQYGGRAVDFSDDGIVVGRVQTGLDETGSFISEAAIWIDGVKQLLPMPAELSGSIKRSFAVGMSADGTIAGYCERFDGTQVPLRWQNNQVEMLTDPFGYFNTTVQAINASGDIAGTTFEPDGDPIPMQWLAGLPSALPLPPGITYGQVVEVGAGSDGAFSGGFWTGTRWDAIVWRDGGYEIMPSGTEAYFVTYVFQTNKSGQACGYLVPTQSETIQRDSWRALIWNDGQPTDLNTLVDLESGVTLLAARRINDVGQIAANALWHDGSVHHVLLNPV